eukprot:scaffold324679_cov57-Tisochrysis_lutea.AAC.3
MNGVRPADSHGAISHDKYMPGCLSTNKRSNDVRYRPMVGTTLPHDPGAIRQTVDDFVRLTAVERGRRERRGHPRSLPTMELAQ